MEPTSSPSEDACPPHSATPVIGTPLFSEADEAALLASVPDMMRFAEEARNACVAPTLEQRRSVIARIVEYVRAKGRKVYGGHALNAAMLTAAVEEPPIYPVDDPSSGGDIEFYSPDPIGDVRALCDWLFADGHSYVQGKEAMHFGTYTVSVEFVRMCDVSYAPERLFAAIPCFEVSDAAGLLSGCLAVTPQFSLVDHLKILNDPFTSHWRLDRMLPRLMLAQRLFPLALEWGEAEPERAEQQQRRGDEEPLVVLQGREAAAAWAASRTCSVASVGEHALDYFCAPAAPPQRSHRLLMLVSTNLVQDALSLLEAVEQGVQGTDAHVRLREFYPSMDMVGRRILVSVNGVAVASLLDARGKALPVCGVAADGINVARASYVVMTSLALLTLADADGNAGARARHERVVAGVLSARAAALSAEGTDVTSTTSTPFREGIGCYYIGSPLSDMRIHMAMVDERRVLASAARGRKGGGIDMWFKYDPSKADRGKRQPFMLRCDGTEVQCASDSMVERERALHRLQMN